MPKIRIVVADDHPLFRMALVLTLTEAPGMEIVGEGASVADALRMAANDRPDLVLLDVDMPGDALSAIAQIRAICADIKSVIITAIGQSGLVCSAMQKGAWGYLLKEMTGPELVQAVTKIYEGERYVTPALAADLLSTGPAEPKTGNALEAKFSSLNLREEEILALISVGQSNKQIGKRLHLSERSVKHYTSILLQKLDVRNRVEAAALNFAREHTAIGSDHPRSGNRLYPST
jgi:DNA-binding NarL/FixJ family response regulator